MTDLLRVIGSIEGRQETLATLVMHIRINKLALYIDIENGHQAGFVMT